MVLLTNSIILGSISNPNLLIFIKLNKYKKYITCINYQIFAKNILNVPLNLTYSQSLLFFNLNFLKKKAVFVINMLFYLLILDNDTYVMYYQINLNYYFLNFRFKVKC
jgi:hypothetical protein